MRYLLTTLLAGVLLLGTGFTKAQVTKNVSEVTGVERLESESMRPLHDENYAGNYASFRAEYVNDPDEGPSWVFVFYGFTEDTTQVSRTNQMLVQADGRQLEPVRLASKTRAVNEKLIEIKQAVFTRADFEALATARTVTLSLGPAQFTAIHPRRKDLRLILDRVPGREAPQTASNSNGEQ